MYVTDIDLIPVAIPTRPIEEPLGLAPYVGGPAIGDTDPNQSFEAALAACEHVGRERRATLVRLETDAGVTGWGELAGTDAITHSIVEERIAPILRERPVWNVEAFVREAAPAGYGRDHLMTIGGVELALWDAMGKAADRPVYELLGGKCVERVPVAFCLGLLPPEESARKAEEALEHGFSVLKTKACRYWRTDVDRVTAMHEAVDGRLSFRVDPNCEWSVGDAVNAGAALADAGVRLEYLEQPIAEDSFGSLARLRNRLTQPVAINEDAYLPHHLFHALKADAIDAAVVDFHPLGGLHRTRRLAGVVAEANISMAHHSGHDLGLKNAAKAHLAAAIPEFDLAMDATYYAAEGDVLAEPLDIEDGALTVPDRPGLAGEVDPAAVERYRVDG